MLFLLLISSPVQAQEGDNNPFVFQDWCYEHAGCHRFGIRNRTDSWLQILATELQTGEVSFVSIRPGANAFLTARPGPYRWQFTWWCGGKMDTWDVPQAPLNNNWILRFGCPEGYSGAVKTPIRSRRIHSEQPEQPEQPRIH